MAQTRRTNKTAPTSSKSQYTRASTLSENRSSIHILWGHWGRLYLMILLPWGSPQHVIPVHELFVLASNLPFYWSVEFRRQSKFVFWDPDYWFWDFFQHRTLESSSLWSQAQLVWIQAIAHFEVFWWTANDTSNRKKNQTCIKLTFTEIDYKVEMMENRMTHYVWFNLAKPVILKNFLKSDVSLCQHWMQLENPEFM